MDIEQAKDDDGRAGEFEGVALKSARRKARQGGQRHERGQRAEREGQHCQRANREATFGQDIELKRLRKAARQEKGDSAENESATIGLAFRQIMNIVAKGLRHSRQKACEPRQQLEHLKAKQNHDYAGDDRQCAVDRWRKRKHEPSAPIAPPSSV
ncbi:MAG: hypothetical protein WBL55_01545 [Xanthobacteraceae bacterium]